MAIDTAAKRASVQAYVLGAMRPPPDSTVAAGDRATVAFLYGGLTYGAPAPSPSLHRWTGWFTSLLHRFNVFF